MRLRLTVQRHSLPVSNILWSVPDTASSQAYTFVRLLEDVNRILPLEAEQWGLEDYIIELGGFECLHFSPVLQTLKEDDHISIRPLLTAEVRSRTLCGRTQISEDGRHLVDGIPFGRPYLKQPFRPAVSIPPRKRVRVEQDPISDSEAPESAGFITAAGEAFSHAHNPSIKKNRKERKEVQFAPAQDEGSDDTEDDEDFVPGHVSEGSIDSDSDESSSVASKASVQPTKSNKRHFALEREPSDTSSASDTDSSSRSSSDSDTDSQSRASGNATSSADSSSDSNSDSNDSDSGSDSDSDNSAPDVLSSKPTAPPWSGSKETRRRNFRRKQLVKLKQLKTEGKLRPDATYADLQLYLETLVEPKSPKPTPAQTMSKPTGKRKRWVEDVEGQEIQISKDESAELERRREELMARLADSTPDVETTPLDSSTPPLVEEADHVASISASPAVTPGSASKRTTPTPPTKRLRPNVSAIGRILQRQAVNTERKASKSKKPLVVEESEPEGASDPEFWKSRISLSAFECWDEDHELSAPPFPFEQHWDSASKLMRENQQNAKQKKRAKKSKPRTDLVIHDNEDEEPEETPVLDYEDSPEKTKTGCDPTDAIESQIIQDVNLATKSDLPPLPEDSETLLPLQPHDIQVGAVVVFKLYAIDPVTVTPHISEYKTAIVEKEGDLGNGAGTFRLKLADRDVPQRSTGQVDEKGNPADYAVNGFRMSDEEDEDVSVWEGTFGELVEPKLLRAAK